MAHIIGLVDYRFLNPYIRAVQQTYFITYFFGSRSKTTPQKGALNDRKIKVLSPAHSFPWRSRV